MIDKLKLQDSVKDLLTQFCEGNAIGYKYLAILKKKKEFKNFIYGESYKDFCSHYT